MTAVRRGCAILGMLAITLALSLAGSGVALAHNHVLNPSGCVNQSPAGADGPGNTSGLTNPAGKPVGQAQAFARGNAERACR